MDASSIIGILGGLATAAASTFGVLKWIGGYRSKLVIAQNIAAAAKAGAEGALSLLTEVIAASDKNSLTTADVNQIVATASDIPGAIKTALKISTVTKANPAAIIAGTGAVNFTEAGTLTAAV